MRTERRLAQKGGHELVPVHLVDATTHGATATIEARMLLELAILAQRYRAGNRLCLDFVCGEDWRGNHVHLDADERDVLC